MTTDNITSCENCNRTIGRLEPRFSYQSHTVCAECYARLSGNPAPATPSTPPIPAPTPTAIPPIATPSTPVAVPPVYSASTTTPTAPSTAHATSSTHPDFHSSPADDPKLEKVVFEGHPSIVIYLGSLLLATAASILGIIGWIYFGNYNTDRWYSTPMRWLCILGLILGLLTLLVRYLQIEYIKYRLSNQRFFITTGILARKTVETELFRVRDISVHQSLIERMLGIGTIRALTTDKDIPQMQFAGIREPLKVKEYLRQHIMEARQRTRTRDLDVADIDDSQLPL